MRLLIAIDKAIDLINEFIASFGIAFGVFLAFFNVIARFVFNKGIDWAFELTNYLFIWSALFGASYCFKKDCHIKVTILVDLLPNKLQNFFSLVANIIILFYLLAVTYFGYVFIFDPDFGLKASEEISIDLNVPMWIPYLALPISFLISSYIVLKKILQQVRK